jgi:hypothetical protein
MSVIKYGSVQPLAACYTKARESSLFYKLAAFVFNF